MRGLSGAVAHRGHRDPVGIEARRAHDSLADGSLEHDERVSLVVSVGRMGLASGAEVGVGADSALVADPRDVRHDRVRPTQGTVAADALVNGTALELEALGKRLIDRREAVAGMLHMTLGYTVVAVVPVGAVEALVSDTSDEIIAIVTDGIVGLVATRC